MIPLKEYLVLIILIGIILFVEGIIGFIIPYQPLHLVSAGLILFFAGYYYYTAEVESEKIRRHEL
jgi:uncharacterized membrane protein